MQASDLATAISSQNVLIPTALVPTAQPAPANNQYQLSLSTRGRLVDPKQFGDITVRANQDGSILRLRDVARIELGAQLYQTLGALNGKPATLVILYQTPDANALSTTAAVRAKLDELSKAFPPGLKYAVAYDSTLCAADPIKDVLEDAAQRIVLLSSSSSVFFGKPRSSSILMRWR